MARISSILIYGHDLAVLESRSWVLENRGYQVSITRDINAWIAEHSHDHLELVILCHTLAAWECESVAITTEPIWPSLQFLVLFVGTLGCYLPRLDHFFDIKDGPAQFLAAVRQATHPELSDIVVRFH